MRMDQPRVTVDWEAVDWGRVDEAVLAIMLLGLHDDWRTWKGIDWEVLNRLHEKGLITDPKSKAKSVIFTEEGLESAQQLFEKLFSRSTEQPAP
jgi:hypothetical protein